jgi:hypothetical protein
MPSYPTEMASYPTETTTAMKRVSERKPSQMGGARSQPSRDACSTGQGVRIIRPKFAAMVGFYP